MSTRQNPAISQTGAEDACVPRSARYGVTAASPGLDLATASLRGVLSDRGSTAKKY
jgi:hypothetical protein